MYIYIYICRIFGILTSKQPFNSVRVLGTWFTWLVSCPFPPGGHRILGLRSATSGPSIWAHALTCFDMLGQWHASWHASLAWIWSPFGILSIANLRITSRTYQRMCQAEQISEGKPARSLHYTANLSLSHGAETRPRSLVIAGVQAVVLRLESHDDGVGANPLMQFTDTVL